MSTEERGDLRPCSRCKGSGSSEPEGEGGMCGDRSPHSPVQLCVLPFGHNGWHRGEGERRYMPVIGFAEPVQWSGPHAGVGGADQVSTEPEKRVSHILAENTRTAAEERSLRLAAEAALAASRADTEAMADRWIEACAEIEAARVEVSQLRAKIEAERDQHQCSDRADIFGGYECGHCGDSYATTVGCINKQRLNGLLAEPLGSTEDPPATEEKP